MKNRLWIALAAAGFLLRAEYLREFSSSVLFSAAVGPDVAEYHAWAIRILAGRLLPETLPIHAPLYPFFLSGVYAVFGISVPAARVVQTGLNFGAWLLLYFLLRHKVERDLPRLKFLPEIFLALAMLVPIPVYYQAELVCETLLLPLFSLLMLFWVLMEEKQGRKHLLFAALAGLVCGLAVITHPMTLGAAGLLFAVNASRTWRIHTGLPALLLWLLAFLLPVMTVSVIHSAAAGRPVFIQGNGAFNLYLGHGPEADGSCRLRPGKAWNDFHAQIRREAGERGISADALLLGRIADFYRTEPEKLPLLFCRKAALAFSPRELISGADPEPVIFFTGIQQGGRFFLIVLLPLVLIGAIRLCRCRQTRLPKVTKQDSGWITKKTEFAILSSLPAVVTGEKVQIPDFRETPEDNLRLLAVTSRQASACFLPWLCWGAGLFLVQCLTVSSGRYRTAMFPVFYLLSAYALLELASVLRQKQWRLWICWMLGIAAFTLYYRCTAPGKQAEIESRVLYAEGEMAHDHPGAALEHYTAVRRLAGDDTLYAAPAGRAKELLGDPNGALAEYRKSIASGDVNGWVNCGVIHLKRGEVACAGDCFARAAAHPGANANAYYNYGIFLYDFTPRRREGLAAVRRAVEMDPAHADAWNRLGAVAFVEHRYADAVRYFERAVALRPADRNFLRNLMAACGAAGKTRQAEAAKAKLRRLERKGDTP